MIEKLKNTFEVDVVEGKATVLETKWYISAKFVVLFATVNCDFIMSP